MRKILLALLIVASWIAPRAGAQPFVFYRGIVNAASGTPQALPNGAIARGSIFSIFGRGLGPETGAVVTSFPLNPVFPGVGIDVCQQETCVAAIPIFVRADQINAILPSDAPLGEVSVRVIYNGEVGNFSPARTAQVSFGAFAISGGGFGPAILQNFMDAARQPINSTAAPAKSGQTVVLWGTGLGPGLNADNVAPEAGQLPVAVDIWVGGKPVTMKRYSGRTPCCSGVDELVFDLPSDAPTGCYVPVLVKAGDVVSNATTMAISADGSPCGDPANPSSATLRAGGDLGRIFLTRTFRDLETGAGNIIADEVSARFASYPGGVWAWDPDLALPPVGTCMLHQARGATNSFGFLGEPPAQSGLDAGAQLTVMGAAQVDTPQSARLPGSYEQFLGGEAPGFDPAPPVFEAGSFQVSTAGSAAIGAFNVETPAASQLNWTNRTELKSMNRGQDATFQWQPAGSAGDLIWISGGGFAIAGDAKTMFSCLAPASAGEFTVPAHILANVPASRPTPTLYDAWVGVALLGPGVPFTARGLDDGRLLHYVNVIEPVEFQ